MPVPFIALPFHIRLEIMEKIDFQDVRNLEQTCHQLNVDLSKLKRKITWEEENFTIRDCDGELAVKASEMGYDTERFIKRLEKLPVRIQAQTVYLSAASEPDRDIWSDFTDDHCSSIARFLEITRSAVNCLFICSRHTTCSPENFATLLNACRAKNMQASKIPVNCLRTEAARNLESMDIDCKIEDEDFLKLKAGNIRIENSAITAVGLNAFFKEWLSGSREITKMFIGMPEGISIEDVFTDIDHNVEKIFRKSESRFYKIGRGDQILLVEVCMSHQPQNRITVMREDLMNKGIRFF